MIEHRRKIAPPGAARAAARRAAFYARAAHFGHPADAPRRVAARRSVDVIKLAADLIGRSLEARTFHLIKTVCARRSCTIPRCPQLRSPHVHREHAALKPHSSRLQNVGFNLF